MVRASFQPSVVAVALLVCACSEGEQGRDDAFMDPDGPAVTTVSSTIGDPSGGSDSTGAEGESTDAADEGSSTGEPPTACDDGELPITSALVFDGVDDHVAMGLAPQL